MSWSDLGNFTTGMLDTASAVVKGVAAVGICGSIGWNIGAAACVSTSAAAVADLNDGAAKIGSVIDNVVIGVGQSADVLLGTDAWTAVSDVTPEDADFLAAVGNSDSAFGKGVYVAMKANQAGQNLKDIYRGVRDLNIRRTWTQVKQLSAITWGLGVNGLADVADTISDYSRVLDNVKAATWDAFSTGSDLLGLGVYAFGSARRSVTANPLTGQGSVMPIGRQASIIGK